MYTKKIFLTLLTAAMLFSSFHLAYSQSEEKEKTYKDMIEEYNKGNKSRAFNIAFSYKYAWNGAPQDPKKAIEWFDKAFEAGNARAATLVGSMYRTGDGVKPDFAKAEKYYRKAASKGNEAAAIRLGHIYYYGSMGVRKSYSAAKKWYGGAAEKYANTDTCSIVCKYYADMNFYTTPSEPDHKANYDEAIKWYTKAFNAGVMEASVNLASLTYKTWYGAHNKPSPAKAIKYLTDAANNGYNPAMQELVDISYNGTYGKQDMAQAYIWAAVLASRNDTMINSANVMKNAESKMTAAEKTKAKKAAAALVKKLADVYYVDKSSQLD